MSMFFPGMYANQAVGQAVTPASYSNPMSPLNYSMGQGVAPPQAQEMSGGDRFWEAFNAALPGFATAGDMLSRQGMLEGPVMGNRGVPAAQPYIGPGLLGLSALVNASSRGGF